MKQASNRRIGRDYEAWAEDYLKKLGYVILEKNFCCRGGEIDIVAKDNGYLVFVEVKYRSTVTHGCAAEAVDFHKQMRIRRAALIFMKQRKINPEMFCRFDVVAIDGTDIRVIKNAF